MSNQALIDRIGDRMGRARSRLTTVRLLSPAEVAAVDAHHRPPQLAALHDELAYVSARIAARAAAHPDRADAIRASGAGEIRALVRKIARTERRLQTPNPAPSR